MARINFEDLGKIREKFKDKKIVFCSGAFDLTHVGHAIFFEGCKKLGDVLVVSVGCDNLLKQNKGPQRPILNQSIRLKMVDSLKGVDYVILDEFVQGDNALRGAVEMIGRLNPDIYAVNSDAFDMNQRREIAKKFSCELKILEKPEEFKSVSTSKIIEKIKETE